MKVNTKRLINVLNGMLNFAWYINFILIAIALTFLIKEVLLSTHSNVNYDVTIPSHLVEDGVKVDGDGVINAKLIANSGQIQFKMQNNLFSQIGSFLLFILLEAIIISVLYYLRLLFRNLKNDIIFCYENCIWLEKLAIVIALFFPFQLLGYMLTNYIIRQSFSGNFNVKSGFNFTTLIVAAIVLITAFIFKRGLELKKENEEFV